MYSAKAYREQYFSYCTSLCARRILYKKYVLVSTVLNRLNLNLDGCFNVKFILFYNLVMFVFVLEKQFGV